MFVSITPTSQAFFVVGMLCCHYILYPPTLRVYKVIYGRALAQSFLLFNADKQFHIFDGRKLEKELQLVTMSSLEMKCFLLLLPSSSQDIYC